MTALVTLRPGLSLEVEAAASWARMERAKGSRLDVNRSTVSREKQLKMFHDWRAYANGTGPKPNHGRAIHPDDSWHCLPRARAVDTDDDKWIRANPAYGWRFVVRDERWHAQYYPELDKYRGTGFPDAKPKPKPETEEDDEMPIIIVQRKNSQLAKGMMTHNRKMREITRWENICYRAAERKSPTSVIYVTVDDDVYKNLLAGKD